VFRQLREGFRKGGGTVNGAIANANKELDEAMSELQP
jgi:hypothetical protein